MRNHYKQFNKFKLYDFGLLPTPHRYYSEQFPSLKQQTGKWVSVPCCFHQDRNPSLRINLNFGGFHCFGCGAHGSNIIAFHSLRYELSFREALAALEGGL